MFSPHVNNYLNYNNSPSFFNYRGRQTNYSHSPRPYGAHGWHRGGRFQSPPTRDISSNYANSWDPPPVCSRSPSILADRQPRKRLNYTNNISKQNKKSKQSLGKEYRRNLIDKLPKQHVPASSTVTIQPIACSTPQKDSIVVTDDKSPQVLPESPLLELKGSNHEHTQPFDHDAWTKDQITQIRDIENTEATQSPC